MEDSATRIASDLSVEWMSDEQSEIHRQIIAIGGYWSPEFGALRLIEEIGELLEKLGLEEGATSAPEEAPEQLADIYIISTCIANQFGATLPQLSDISIVRGTVTNLVIQLVQVCGRVSRLVNFYSGPKLLHDPEHSSSLRPLTIELHGILLGIAIGLGAALQPAINTKIAKVVARGIDPPSFDPISAESAAEFQSFARDSNCIFARGVRVWGAPPWDTTRSIVSNVDSISPYLIRFAHAAQREKLDGFVVAPEWKLGTGSDLGPLSSAFNRFLRALAGVDPSGNRVSESEVRQRDWQFSFASVRMFITVFSPNYPPRHVRHSPRPFVFLQPEQSFSHHKIGREFPESQRLKDRIRRAFTGDGYEYPNVAIDARLEADIYILPVNLTDDSPAWWMADGQQPLFF